MEERRTAMPIADVPAPADGAVTWDDYQVQFGLPSAPDEPTPADTHQYRLGEERTRDAVEARAYAIDSPLVATSGRLHAYAEPSFSTGRPLVDAALDLMSRIHAELDYQPGTTTTTTPVGEVLAHRAGVGQDSAHLAVGCLRSMGIPARYVSGYLETDPPPGGERQPVAVTRTPGPISPSHLFVIPPVRPSRLPAGRRGGRPRPGDLRG